MRKLFSTLSMLLLLQAAAYSQVIITEIMYNIPGNTEAVEFIELYNNTNTSVTLNGYVFTQGIDYTFPAAASGAITLAPDNYYVIAIDSAAYKNTFGMNADAIWSSNGLSNGAEDIVIYDATGVMVDSVDYKDKAPWPLDADGLGHSLQLCDLLTIDRNLGTNWGISNDFAGTVSTGDSIFATPGAANNCSNTTPPPPPPPAAVGYPLYTIDMINGLNAKGEADSLNVTCELRAVAYCVNTRGNKGLDFPFAQSNNSMGIRVFSMADVSNYNHTSGDSLHIWGKVSQFKGLLQFAPDSIVVISQGISVPAPMVVTQPSEMTENKRIQLNNVHLVDPAKWTGSGFGFNVLVTDGSTDTTLVRIDSDIDLFSQPAPMGSFNISGWGGQYDHNAPYKEYYQLLPCSVNSLLGTTQLEAPLAVRIYPNPTSRFMTIEAGSELETVVVYNALGQVVLSLNDINAISTQINTSDFANGIYTISIVSGDRVNTQLFQVVK